MQNTAIREIHKDRGIEIRQDDFSWSDNPSIQKLLDVVVSIIVEEYIRIAKGNPDVFSSGSGTTPNTYREMGLMNQTTTMLKGEKGKMNKNGGWK